MTTYIWKMRRDVSELLGSLRTEPGLEVCADEEVVWIRYEDANAELQQRFKQLPVVGSIATKDGQLIEHGTRVPRGYVAQGPWVSISQWMRVTLPVAGLGAASPQAISMAMIRSEAYESPRLLLAEMHQRTTYAVAAPRIRLDRLAFAATDRSVFIRGEPLPPIAGKRFVLQGRIAVEAGWTWSPAVSVDVLEAVLAIETGQLAVMYGNGRWEILRDDDFVQASRSAVRTAAEEIGHVG